MKGPRMVLDQMGREVEIPAKPQRIVSLVPSQTELLIDLGLEHQLVGRTKFCIHPKDRLAKIPIIGGTKNFRIKDIQALKPDLIIGNKEENYPEGIAALAQHFPVWMSDIYTLQEALEMIREVGNLTGRPQEATVLAASIGAALRQPQPLLGSALYLIWRQPWMAAGTHTFIDDLLPLAGFENALKQPRYPELSAEAIQALAPEYILLSSEPYPFQEGHAQELRNILPTAKILSVDGEIFSWYGSRLLKAPAYFQELRLRLG
jgi:ABC-type Fe3+-hydroxamate transport system substrate-binding protein